jgi:hypothetical protein
MCRTRSNPQIRLFWLTHPLQAINIGTFNHFREREIFVANHLTPTELADELNMKRREVIAKCMEMGVPIFNGRIDKSLFLTSLRSITQRKGEASAA